MRVAWIGPPPTDGHGVAFTATQMLGGLSAAGVEVDCFVAAAPGDLPECLRGERKLHFFCRPPHWQWDRWYSRTPLQSFVTSQLARAGAQSMLASRAARRHAEEPYDVLYQFSQIELGWVRRLRHRLPPIALHPEVHAAGELRWLRREWALARRCEPAWRLLAVRAMLWTRSLAQARDLRLARRVIAPSRRFAEHLGEDCGLLPERLSVVPNPIDLQRFSPGEPREARGEPVNILFVSRISVRKGVDMVVALSNRLRDLAGEVRVTVVGEHSLWSDYRPLLRDLDSAVATYAGPAEGDVAEVYRGADLLIQPAHYEPFALTVGEALASGLPVVVSDEVGAREGVDARCCRVFATGDIAALEAEVRKLLAELRDGAAPQLRVIARQEAERLFDPVSVGSRLARTLEQVAS
jgi:glycosyltransferase involved in cell wall biosynthesis